MLWLMDEILHVDVDVNPVCSINSTLSYVGMCGKSPPIQDATELTFVWSCLLFL